MSGSLDNMDSTQLDIFKEIGNIGAGNAATSLASILNKKINMSVPEVSVVPFNDIVNIMNGPETLVVGVLVDMSGDMKGYIMLVLGLRDAYEMAMLAMGETREVPENISIGDMNEMELSALKEISNILVGSYLSAICTMTGLQVQPSVPQLAMDMVGAIISIVAIEYGTIGDSVLFMKTQFADDEKDIDGHFFLIPDFESYKILMGSLGLDV